MLKLKEQLLLQCSTLVLKKKIYIETYRFEWIFGQKKDKVSDHAGIIKCRLFEDMSRSAAMRTCVVGLIVLFKNVYLVDEGRWLIGGRLIDRVAILKLPRNNFESDKIDGYCFILLLYVNVVSLNCRWKNCYFVQFK